MQSWRFMQDKEKYTIPTIIISSFSVKDVIFASGPVPCPGADEPCDEDFETNVTCSVVS